MTRAAAALVIAAVVSSIPWGARPVEAREAPWCAVIAVTDDSVYWDCQYNSFEQCRAVILSGNRGWCNPSPYATPGAEDSKRKPRKSRGS